MERIKIFIWGDAVTPTGFSTVIHSIFTRFPSDKYDIHQLGINYSGDPHNVNYKIYPAASGGDIYGFNRMAQLLEAIHPDIIFLLNDLWVINSGLEAIKQIYKDKPLPRIIIYFPVDAEEFDQNWFLNFNLITQAVVYTQFGYDVVTKCKPEVKLEIIPHGVDTRKFYTLPQSKKEIRSILYPGRDDIINSFMVLNASRNQPRKRIDTALQAFKIFAEDKDDVRYYHHAGIKDAGWDIFKLAMRYGVDNKLIVTNMEVNVQRVPVEKLNLIYNLADVGLNTSLGEGWGLPSMEHAVTGAPQVVPDHSACRELFWDCGLLVPANIPFTFEKVETVGRWVTPEDVAEKLNDLYYDHELYESLSLKGKRKFTRENYSWDKISLDWQKLFEKVL